MTKTECFTIGYFFGYKTAKRHVKAIPQLQNASTCPSEHVLHKIYFNDTVKFFQVNYCDFCYSKGYIDGYYKGFDKYYKKNIIDNNSNKNNLNKNNFTWNDYEKTKNLFSNKNINLNHSQHCILSAKKYKDDLDNSEYFINDWNESGYFDY